MGGRRYMLPPAGDRCVLQPHRKYTQLVLNWAFFIFICSTDWSCGTASSPRSQSKCKVCPWRDTSRWDHSVDVLFYNKANLLMSWWNPWVINLMFPSQTFAWTTRSEPNWRTWSTNTMPSWRVRTSRKARCREESPAREAEGKRDTGGWTRHTDLGAVCCFFFKLNFFRFVFFICSRSKVVRRVSVNERSSLYRREHQKEAMVWQERGRQPEPQDDDEDRQTDNELHQRAVMVVICSFVCFIRLQSVSEILCNHLSNLGGEVMTFYKYLTLLTNIFPVKIHCSFLNLH